jgi:hypothetical protein
MRQGAHHVPRADVQELEAAAFIIRGKPSLGRPRQGRTLILHGRLEPDAILAPQAHVETRAGRQRLPVRGEAEILKPREVSMDSPEWLGLLGFPEKKIAIREANAQRIPGRGPGQPADLLLLCVERRLEPDTGRRSCRDLGLGVASCMRRGERPRCHRTFTGAPVGGLLDQSRKGHIAQAGLEEFVGP